MATRHAKAKLKLDLRVRGSVHNSGMRQFAALGLIFLATLLTASEKSSYRKGKLLDSSEREDADARRSYFCVEVYHPDRIMIGETTPRHRGLGGWKLAIGQPVKVRYDDTDLWIRSSHGNVVRLRQDYLTPAFSPGSICEKIVDAALARQTAPPKTLRTR